MHGLNPNHPEGRKKGQFILVIIGGLNLFHISNFIEDQHADSDLFGLRVIYKHINNMVSKVKYVIHQK
jgi:hypothetical protein